MQSSPYGCKQATKQATKQKCRLPVRCVFAQRIHACVFAPSAFLSQTCRMGFCSTLVNPSPAKLFGTRPWARRLAYWWWICICVTCCWTGEHQASRLLHKKTCNCAGLWNVRSCLYICDEIWTQLLTQGLCTIATSTPVSR